MVFWRLSGAMPVSLQALQAPVGAGYKNKNCVEFYIKSVVLSIFSLSLVC